MGKHPISDLLNELKSNEAYIRSDAIKKIIKGKMNDEPIILALKEVIENDHSMAIRNFARSALDVFGIEHSAVEEPIVEMRNIEVHAEPLKANNEDQPIDLLAQPVTKTKNLIGTFGAGWLSGFIVGMCPALTPTYFSSESTVSFVFLSGLLLFVFGLLISFFLKSRSLKVWPLVLSGLGLGLCSPIICIALYIGMGGAQ